MSINIAVVPVAGLGTRLLPATKSQPKEMLPVGRKPVVQYVVEELTRVGMERLLFITGPGKASIENHFDLNARAHAGAARNRQGRPARGARVRARARAVLLHAPAAAARPWPRRALRPLVRRTEPVRGGARRLDHRPACVERRRAADGRGLRADRCRRGRRVRGGAARRRCAHYGIARPGPAADGCSGSRISSRSPGPRTRRARWRLPRATCCRRRSSTRSNTRPRARAAKSS